MKRRVLIIVVLGGALALTTYFLVATESRGTPEARPRQQISVELSLDPDESLVDAAAGDLIGDVNVSLILGTALHPDGGRLRILQQRGPRYEEIWSITNSVGVFDGAIVRDVNNDHRNDLISLWRSGQGGYLNVRVFEWDGRTFREIWNLGRSAPLGQLTQAANLSIRRVDDVGNVEIVIRAPNVKPGESALGALAHQVSVYRWDRAKRAFVLTARSIDKEESFD